jgi:beta-N-acetylhexosaminidase
MDKDKTTLNVMAGQRLMLGFDGVELNSDLKYIIDGIKACGIILFKRNIETPEQVAFLCKSCQEYAKSCGLPPLFIAVDQEGGTVARLQKPFTIFKGNPYIKSVEDAKHFALITADELHQVGINMNFAPVLDIVPDSVDSIMKERVFKGDAKRVSSLGMEVILGLQKNGIMAVAKHFPGIGRTVKDSHFHLPVLDIDLKTLEQSDMLPFKDAIGSNVSGIMLSHVSYPKLDKKWQASLSPFIANGLLRNQMGYEGLVMTDDLDMKAIEHDMKTSIRQILKSGIDIALICHKGPDINIAYNEITKQINQNENLYQACNISLQRILKYKKKYLLDSSS